MDFEGIAVDSYTRGEQPLDIEAVGAEASVLVKSIQRASEMLDAGATREVSIQSERMVTLIRVLNDSYFIALTLRPDGNLGKARYLLRVVAPKLLHELV
jgi:predicted regulator of Ras-like GTPase activity (Roadblock/LC7/MglB family)